MSGIRRLAQRRCVFAALVSVQDEVGNVAASYDIVCERFGITREELRAIEDEGLAQSWPPLNDPCP